MVPGERNYWGFRFSTVDSANRSVTVSLSTVLKEIGGTNLLHSTLSEAK